MEVGNKRLCALSTDSVFCNIFGFFENKNSSLEKCTELCYKHSKNIKNNVTTGIYLEKIAN